MTFRIINETESSMDYSVVNIDAWWDRHSRIWIIQKLNKDGYQVGDAEFAGNREDKDWIVKRLKEECGIK